MESLIEIDIIRDYDFYFCVKFKSVIMKLEMISRLYYVDEEEIYDSDNNIILDNFINGITNEYDEDDYAYVRDRACSRAEDDRNFNIKIRDDNIKISNTVAEISLLIENKDLLIEAMKKYRSMLNDYVK